VRGGGIHVWCAPNSSGAHEGALASVGNYYVPGSLLMGSSPAVSAAREWSSDRRGLLQGKRRVVDWLLQAVCRLSDMTRTQSVHVREPALAWMTCPLGSSVRCY
jgi:hypothetical protein